ncbi:MAG: response regulator transcription factor [Sedimentibacter sp.]
MNHLMGDKDLIAIKTNKIKTNKIKTNTQYFSQALKGLIGKIPQYPVTIVEAASGYGKTTCIRHFFTSLADADVRWVSFSTNETAEKAWGRCCNCIRKIDSDVGNRLFSLGLPSSHNTDEICQLLYEFSCDEDTYLIFDNFQHIQKYFTKEIWEAFLFNNSKLLHIIVLTHIINKESEFLTQSAKCLYISSDDLKLNKMDINQYFKKAGLILESDEITFLYEYSEGWIAPLYLQLLYFWKNGHFQENATINTMIEKAVLEFIGQNQKQTLISLSFFDSFTEEQVAFISQNNQYKSFEKIPFLSFDKRKLSYTFHTILREVLQMEFSKLPKEEQINIISLSAQWYVKINNKPNAILMYCEIGQYRNAISVIDESSVFDHISLLQSKEEYLDLLRKITFTYIDDSIILFPSAYILIAFEFFTQCCYEEYGRICQTFHSVLESGFIEEQKRDKIEGELALIESFSVYNNISQMGLYQQKAFNLLDGKCSSITPRDPWTFGNPSIVSLYWSEIGEIDTHISNMNTFIPLYSAVVKGHGTGADVIFNAEIALLRGDDVLAESLCYKGIFLSKSANQESLYLSAVFVLLRVAMIRGDKEMYELCTEYLIESEKSRAVHYELSEITLILCHARLQFNSQKQQGISAQDLVERILPMTETFGFCLRGRELLLQGKFIQLQILFEEAMGLSEGLNSQLTKLYFTIYMAIAKLQGKNLDMATHYLSEALDMALPDGIILPFAENYDLLKELLNENNDMVPQCIMDICSKYKKGLQTLRKTLYADEIFKELTTMEYEVYKLAAEKKKNKEIAKELFISENTVKTHLAHIYSKLGVKSKTEL